MLRLRKLDVQALVFDGRNRDQNELTKLDMLVCSTIKLNYRFEVQIGVRSC